MTQRLSTVVGGLLSATLLVGATAYGGAANAQTNGGGSAAAVFDLTANAADSNRDVGVPVVSNPIGIDFSTDEYDEVREGTDAVVTVDLKAAAGASGNIVVVIAGPDATDIGTPTDGTTDLTAATGGVANGWVVPVASGAMTVSVTIPTVDDALWEHGEEIALSFDDMATEWTTSAFTVDTSGDDTAAVPLAESTTQPKITLWESVPSVTERNGGGQSSFYFSWNKNWPDSAPSTGTGSVGKIPQSYKMRFTLTTTMIRGGDRDTGDYYFSSPSALSPSSTITERNFQSGFSDDGPETTIQINEISGAQGARDIVITGEIRDQSDNVVPGFNLNSITVTVHDNVTIELVAMGATITESDAGEAAVDTTWRVTLNTPPGRTTAFQVTASGSLGPDEYTLPMVPVNPSEPEGEMQEEFVRFSSNTTELTKDITVAVLGDDTLEVNETLILAIYSADADFPSGAEVVANNASLRTVMVQDNDDVTITITGSSETTVAEDVGTVAFTAQLSHATEVEITAEWRLATGGGTDAADHGGTLPTGSLTFPAGHDPASDDAQAISVPVADDGDTNEPAEQFTVELHNFNLGGSTSTRVTAGTHVRSAVTIAADPPGSPRDLQATGEQRAMTLSWLAPGDGAGAPITGYRIQSSPTGRSGSWTNLEENTGSAATTYRHLTLSDGQIVHYRVFASNSGGESPYPSRTATGMTWAAADANNDGQVTADDGLVFTYVLRGLPPEPAVRRTLLRPYLPLTVDRTDDNAVDEAIETLIANRSRLNISDVNGDGTGDQSDAELLLNVKGLPELVGDGTQGSGFRVFRQEFVEPHVPGATPGAKPTDERLLEVIRTVRDL